MKRAKDVKGVTQRKDGYWIVYYYDSDGVRRSKSFGKGRKGENAAVKFKMGVDLDKAKGKEVRASSSMHLDELAQLYLDDLKAKNRSMSYRKDIAAMLNNHVLPMMNRKPVDKLTYHDVTAKVTGYYQDRGVCQKTINRYLSYLKIIFNWGQEFEYTNSNPLRRWKKPREEKRRVKLDLDDLKKIMKHAAPHLAWAIEVQFNLGTRPGPSELFKIRWEDVNFNTGRVYVFATKIDESRDIPVSPGFLRRLHKRKQQAQSDYVIEYKGRPIKKLRSSLKTACGKAGITYNVRMYDIRHLFATTQLVGGADLAAVSALLGHKDISTTQQHYYELLKGEKERAVNMLPSLL